MEEVLRGGDHGGYLKHDVQLYGEGVHCLAEEGPLIAILKPKGLAINGRDKSKDCIIHRLQHTYGGKWYALRRFWLHVKTYGIVFCAKDSDAVVAEEVVRNAPIELCFDAVVYVENLGSGLEDELLALPAVDAEANLCKLDEMGRLAHVLATVFLPRGGASVSEVADALVDAFAKTNCPVVGSLRGCRRLKGRALMKNERALSLVRVHCGGLCVRVPLDNRLEQLLEHECSFVLAEEMQNSEHMTTLIEILTGPQASDHCKYAPELQRLGVRRLGTTPEAARNTLDALKLLEPQDIAWGAHATAQLEKYVLDQWLTDPRARERLQYGIHVSRLLCCFVRVQRDGLPPVEWLVQGTRLEKSAAQTQATGPLRATDICFDRSNHCELLALNDAYTLCLAHSELGDGCEIDLIVAQQPCVSCAAAMCNFVARLPHSQLRVGFRDWGSMQRALNAAVRNVEQ